MGYAEDAGQLGKLGTGWAVPRIQRGHRAARRLAWRAIPVQTGRLCGSEGQRVLTAAARGAGDL